MLAHDYTKEEDYDIPLTDWNKYATLKNVQYRCKEIAYDWKNNPMLFLSEVLGYFKSQNTNFGLLFRWKGVKGAYSLINTELNNALEEVGITYGVKLYIDSQFEYIEKLEKNKLSQKPKSNKRLISGRVRQNVLMRDNYTCQICGATVKDGAKLEIDHIIPYSKGGTNKESNLQVLCQQCNREKHNRDDLLHDKRKLAELEGK